MAADRRLLPAILLLLANSIVATTTAPENCNQNERPLIIALLALHSGSECHLVVEKGAQQIAALELTLEKLNNESADLKLDLKVMDTCSSREEAVKAGLRSLVYVEQTCTKPPLFLGFLGPDEPASLQAVSRVSSLFQHLHVVPRAVRSFGQYNAINVEVNDPVQKAENVMLILKDMHWASFILVHTSDSAMTQTATKILESDDFCVLQSVLQVPSSTYNQDGNVAYNRLLHFLQQAEDSRVVFLSDTSASAETLLLYLDGVAPKAKFVVYLQGSGIFPWKLSKGIANNVHILQETIKPTSIPEGFLGYLEASDLWKAYLEQHKEQESCINACKSSDVVSEATVLPLVHALQLYFHGLRTVHSTKCTGSNGVCHKMTSLSIDEWRTALEGAVTFSTGHKIRFYMEADDHVDVFIYNTTMSSFENIGTITHGKYLNLKSTAGLFIVDEDKDKQCFGEVVYRLATEPQKEEINVTVAPTKEEVLEEERDILSLIFTHSHMDYWELVGYLVGIAVGIVLFLLIITCMVYKSFRVKPKDNYSEASSTSDRQRSPIRSRSPRGGKAKKLGRSNSERST